MDLVTLAMAAAMGGGGSGGGSSGGVLVVRGTTTDGVTTLDKTWQEIVDAGFSVLSTYNSERDVTLIESFGGYMVNRENPDIPVYFVFYGNDLTFGAPSANDYPNDEGLR